MFPKRGISDMKLRGGVIGSFLKGREWGGASPFWTAGTVRVVTRFQKQKCNIWQRVGAYTNAL